MQQAADSTSDIGRSAVRRSAWRLLPYLFLLYIIAYLDRVNVAFAKRVMMADLQFSEAVFGLGAGLFFLGYFLLEIPGALIVERWSARKWIARILITWGLCTVAIGFVRDAREFYIARFLLGAAEAGFFPGIVVYLTHWFPPQYRSRALAGFILAVPLSFVIGSPLSGWDSGFGLAGLARMALGVRLGGPARRCVRLHHALLPERPPPRCLLVEVRRAGVD